MSQTPVNLVRGDWVRLRQILQHLYATRLGVNQSPTFAGMTVSGTFTLSNLTATRLVSTNASSELASTDLDSWVSGTANQVNVADNGGGTIILSTPQDIHTAANPTFNNMTLTGTLTFDGAANDGVIQWDNTNDRFQIDDDVIIPSGERILFADSSSSIRYDGTGVNINDDSRIILQCTDVQISTNITDDCTFTFRGSTNDGVFSFDESENELTWNGDMVIQGQTARALTIGKGANNTDYEIFFDGETNNGTITWQEDEDTFDMSCGLLVGDGSAGSKTNYFFIKDDGSIQFYGTGRIDWDKTSAGTVTLNKGTSADAVGDLQTAHDGNFYHVTEAADTPGIELIVDFTSIDAFNWVHVIAIYDGSTTHSVAVQLYNWSTTTWDTFDALQSGQEDVSTAGGYILEDHSFFVPDDLNYIGTGADDGEVRVRFEHTMAGDAAHDMYVDVVALYQ